MREETARRQWELYGILLNNCGVVLTLRDLEVFRLDERIERKTLTRDLSALSLISWMSVECLYNRSGKRGWRVTEIPSVLKIERVLPDQFKCSRCGRVRPTEDFYSDSTKRHGKDTWCKKCRTASNKRTTSVVPSGHWSESSKRGRQRRKIKDRGLQQ